MLDDIKEPPSPRSRDLSIECRARKPTKGVRIRLRTLLNSLGVTAKYSTDEQRDGTLVVLARNEKIKVPLVEFEGRRVIFR